MTEEQRVRAIQQTASVFPMVLSVAGFSVLVTASVQVCERHAPGIGVQHCVVPHTPAVQKVDATAGLGWYPFAQVYDEHWGLAIQQAALYGSRVHGAVDPTVFGFR